MNAGSHLGMVRVEFEVADGLGQSRARLVHTHDLPRSSPGSVEGEGSRIAEDIEHPRPGGEGRNPPSVVPLVEVEPGLVPSLGVGLEGESTFEEGDSAPGEIAGEGDDRFGVRTSPRVEEEHPLRSETLLEGTCQFGEVGEPAPRIHLEDQGPIVEVRHDAGESVIFAMQNAVPGGFGGGDPGSPVERFAEASGEERFSDLLRSPLHEEPNPDRTLRVVESRGEKTALPVEDDGNVSGLAGVTLGGDAPVEEPGVTLADGTFRRGVYPQGDPVPAWLRR